MIIRLQEVFLPSKFIGSGYRTACGSPYLKPYSTTSCNMTVMHDESAAGLVEIY